MSTENQTTGNTNLKKQDLSQLDISTLTPLSPEVISRQATINIGTIGHVAHGKSTVVKAISGVHTVRFKNELERNITIKLERLTPEQIKDICESPTKLRQFAKEQSIKYPIRDLTKTTSDQSTKRKSLTTPTNKRKADTKLDSERQTKLGKYCDMFGMKEKDALNKSLFSGSTTISINGDEASSTASQSLTARDLNDSASVVDIECTSIEMNLRRLCALCKLTHPEFKPTIIPKLGGDIKVKEKGVHEVEYQVSKVIKLEYDDKLKRPSFEVKWKGYTDDDNTWEPIKNIWDCSAFQEFTDQFIRSRRTDMELLWNEMIKYIAIESLEPKLNGREAIEQIKKFNYNEFLAHFFMMIRMRRAKMDIKSKSYQSVYEFLLNDMKHLSYYHRRLDQIQNMHEFQQRINIVDQSKNLHVENVNDFELPPMDDFTYTNDVIPRDGIIIPDDPPVGCNCSEDGECNIKSDCCPMQFDAKFPYTKRGLIRVPQGTPIFECNKACKCSENCPNRVVQKGRKQTLCIFKTEERGWGVRTERAIAKGQYICEYVGEIISYEETERRGKEYDAVGRTYLFDLDFNEKDNPYTVDAAKYGNVSRFINHSCDPNLGVWAVWTNCLDLNLPKLCLFTLRPIKENEELTFDYINCTNSGREQTESNSEDDETEMETDADTEETIESTTEIDIKPIKIETIKEVLIEKSNSPIIQTADTSKNDEVVIKSEIKNEINVNINPITIEIDEDDTDATDASDVLEIPDTSDMKKVPDSAKDTKKEGFTCRCGAAKCRKIIFC